MLNIQVLKGNIVNVDVEAIVNSANNAMTLGEGINRMVLNTGGEFLIKDCLKIGKCQTGKAVLTKGYALTIPNVIHTAAPYWHGGYNNEAKKLASCYIECMKIAEENNFKSIAFPAISTGHGKYPLQEASEIAIATVRSYIINHNLDIAVYFVCFTDDVLLCYKDLNLVPDIDISKYLSREDFDVNKELNKDECKMLKKKLFQKEITQDQIYKATKSVLKRVVAEKGDLILVSSKYQKDEIDAEFCEKYGQTGPFVNMNVVSDIELDEQNKKIKFHVTPFCYHKEEIEALKFKTSNDKVDVEASSSADIETMLSKNNVWEDDDDFTE